MAAFILPPTIPHESRPSGTMDDFTVTQSATTYIDLATNTKSMEQAMNKLRAEVKNLIDRKKIIAKIIAGDDDWLIRPAVQQDLPALQKALDELR